MSLLLNMLSRLLITFLPRSKHLLVSWLQSPCTVILEPKKIKSVSLSISHELMGPDAMTLVVWMLSFKPAFSLSLFTHKKQLFSSSLLSAIRVVSSMHVRSLAFLSAILISDCHSSNPVFHMTYFAYDKPRQWVEKQRYHFFNKDPYSQGKGLSSSHALIWVLDSEEGRTPENWCFGTWC